MIKLRNVFRSILIAAGMVAAPLAAAPAYADQPPNCWLDWNDENTAGIRCSGDRPFISSAQCGDGQLVQGEMATPGTTSYVYCSSRGESLYQPVVWHAYIL
ncbi:hypothetical protein [Nocardia sp. NPDC050406]|uniref:hypothetical protein n=1 Tax=Nocardia sp. NPDC050406 TaxID=3364318 RepID=UPI0037A3D1BB